MKKLVVGTRGSQLALTQTNGVMNLLKRIYPSMEIQIKIIKTTGDKILNKTLSKIGGKGLFVKEIEEALYNKEIDFAVHSMKDVPNTLPSEFTLGAILKREDPRDVLITRNKENLINLRENAVVATGSLRRILQLKQLRRDFTFAPIRGNIDSRIKRVMEGEFDAIVLAAAGLKRMDWEEKISSFLEIEQCIPAVGQGALGLEIRKDDEETFNLLRNLHHEEDGKCVYAERAFLKEMNGGCHIPIGAYGEIRESQMILKGFIGDEDNEETVREEIVGNIEDYEKLGIELAKKIQQRV